MKKALFFLFVVCGTALQAQLAFLRPSPAAEIEQRVGYADIEVEYSRPSMKGREIFGGLVPYDEIWRTGANENTTIEFSHAVKVGGEEIEAGKYALFTKPGKESWEVYFYSKNDNRGVPNPFEDELVVAMLKVVPQQVPADVQTMTFSIDNITEISADLALVWERTRVVIPMEFDTKGIYKEAISTEMRRNAGELRTAASYYLERDMELETARFYQEMAMELEGDPSAWSYNIYAKILHALGEKDEAIKHMKHSLELAEEAENSFIINQDKSLLEEWGAN
jgi:tetratricopeptide (TPR) repeat protein